MTQWLFDTVSAFLVVVVLAAGFVDLYLGEDGRRWLRERWLVDFYVRVHSVSWRSFTKDEAISFARAVSLFRHWPHLDVLLLAVLVRWVVIGLLVGVIASLISFNPMDWLYPRSPKGSVNLTLETLLGYRGPPVTSFYWDLCGYAATGIIIALEMTAAATLLTVRLLRILPISGKIEAVLFALLFCFQIVVGLVLGPSIQGIVEGLWVSILGVKYFLDEATRQDAIIFLMAEMQMAFFRIGDAAFGGSFYTMYARAFASHVVRAGLYFSQWENGWEIRIVRGDKEITDIADVMFLCRVAVTVFALPAMIRLGFALLFGLSVFSKAAQRLVGNVVQDLSNTRSPIMTVALACSFLIKLVQGLGKVVSQ